MHFDPKHHICWLLVQKRCTISSSQSADTRLESWMVPVFRPAAFCHCVMTGSEKTLGFPLLFVSSG